LGISADCRAALSQSSNRSEKAEIGNVETLKQEKLDVRIGTFDLKAKLRSVAIFYGFGRKMGRNNIKLCTDPFMTPSWSLAL
jgi:hypothetical protein